MNTLNPFATQSHASSGGLVQVEQQKAIAEIQARVIVARANPRNPARCTDMILQDCERPSLAEDAVYQYARGGSDISGPSIRLIEAIARRWGNIASGIKEISRHEGTSECVAYAWDLESGYYDERQFQVRHWRDTKGGGYQLKDERDIYELIANMGQRRKRAVLQAMIPGDVIDAAVAQCEKTLTTKADTSPEAVRRMVSAFEGLGVTKQQLSARIQRNLDAITPAQMMGLKRIFASLRDGMSVPGDWFADEASPVIADITARVKERATPEAQSQPTAQAAPASEWPTRREDGRGNTLWIDSAGEIYDEGRHGWNRQSNAPSVNSDGTFRSRRGAAQQGGKEAPSENVPAEPGDTETESVNVAQIFRAIETSTSKEELDEAMDLANSLLSGGDLAAAREIYLSMTAKLMGTKK